MQSQISIIGGPPVSSPYLVESLVFVSPVSKSFDGIHIEAVLSLADASFPQLLDWLVQHSLVHLGVPGEADCGWES